MMRAIEIALEKGGERVVTPDLGGKGNTASLGDEIVRLIETL
jgi:tartrate dehydrogenase/decarboxylase/D-malate dehydrogenase